MYVIVGNLQQVRLCHTLHREETFLSCKAADWGEVHGRGKQQGMCLTWSQTIVQVGAEGICVPLTQAAEESDFDPHQI